MLSTPEYPVFMSEQLEHISNALAFWRPRLISDDLGCELCL